MDVQSAVRTGALFGISQNNIRVTLNRLVASNLLNKAQRGCYTLGAESESLARSRVFTLPMAGRLGVCEYQ